MNDRRIEELLARCDLKGSQDLELLKIDTGFSQPLKSFKVEKKDNYLVFEGDIILDDDKPVVEKGNIIINKFKWPSKEIPYSYDPDLDLDRRDRSWYKTIEAAVKQINEQTNVTLYHVNDPSDVDHIFFNKGADDGRLHAIIGHRPGRGRHEVILSGFFNVGKVLHEVGHSLGLWHEHTRDDRDEHIEIMWDNIYDGSVCVFKKWEDFSIPHGPYDYGSVMHYDAFSPNFAVDPDKPVMRSKDPKQDIEGQRDALSKGDIAAINTLYPI